MSESVTTFFFVIPTKVMVQFLAMPCAVLLLLTCMMGIIMCACFHATRLDACAWVGVVGLTALFAAGLWLRIGVLVPHHMMYVDEPWYEEAARNILQRGAPVLCEQTSVGPECKPYAKAVGWPVLLAVVFAATGPSDAAAFATSATLGALCIPLVGILTILLGGRWHQALLAGTVIAVHPLQLLWSASAETNAAASAFLILGLIGAILHIRTPSWSALILAAGGLSFAAAIRPELSLASVPLMVWLGINRRTHPAQLSLFATAAACGSLSVSLTWGFYEGNSGGAFLAAPSIRENLYTVASDPSGGQLTLLLALMFAVGAAVLYRSDAAAASTLLGCSILLPAIMILAYDPRIFYTRNFLGPLVGLVPFAVLAVPGRLPPISAVLAVGAVFLARAAWPYISYISESQTLENALPTKIADVSLAKDAIVLAEWPTILRAIHNMPAMKTADAVSRLPELLADRPVYLFCDMFCEPGFQGGRGTPACQRVLDGYALEEVTAMELHRRRYGLYRIRQRHDGELPSAAPCPFVDLTSHR